jgi:signal transduction histidine kinase
LRSNVGPNVGTNVDTPRPNVDPNVGTNTDTPRSNVIALAPDAPGTDPREPAGNQPAQKKRAVKGPSVKEQAARGPVNVQPPIEQLPPGAPGFGPLGTGFGNNFASTPGNSPGSTTGNNNGRGRWQLSVFLKAGSLETVVQQARTRNLGLSGAILLLLLATSVALVEFTRRSQRLAEMEMEFVAGVSHELRTPLTVIRTAAFNLRGKLAANPSQVERYGGLIQKESEKLTAIVEQVLQFSSAKSGRVIRERQPTSVESVIENSLQSSKSILEENACTVETHIESGLPVILGDAVALQHALQNLISNAVKYGLEGSKNGTPNWIGIYAHGIDARATHNHSASPGTTHGAYQGTHTEPGASHLLSGENLQHRNPRANPNINMVELKIVDRGPGIPAEEREHIFEAFYRGERAVRDQIHGTGLGLSLVRKIIEAHGGTVDVESQPGRGTTFVLRIPAQPVPATSTSTSDDAISNKSISNKPGERGDEFEHSLG